MDDFVAITREHHDSLYRCTFRIENTKEKALKKHIATSLVQDAQIHISTDGEGMRGVAYLEGSHIRQKKYSTWKVRNFSRIRSFRVPFWC